MPESTEAEIEIAATPERIMAVIANIPDYPQWCPGVRSARVDSSGADGLPEDVELVFDSGPIKDSHRYRYDAWSDSEVRWHLTAGQTVSELIGSYRCVATDTGSTTVHYRLTMKLTVPIIGALRRRAEKVIVRTALQGLKDRVEELA